MIRSKTEICKIGLIQMSVPPVKEAALVKVEKLIRLAARQGAKIICLPELFNVPYFPQQRGIRKELYAETILGETTRALSVLAKKLKVVLIAPIYETTSLLSPPREGEIKRGLFYNTAVVIRENGRSLGKYRKVHLPQDPGFYEKDYFAAGSAYKIFNTAGVKFAVLICYDQWFPEAARAARLAGAEIIFYPTALGDIIGYKPEGDWHDAWQTVQRGHAIANSVYVAAVNRVGSEGRMQFFGQSFVSDPFGKIIKLASNSRDEALVVEIDLARNKFFSEGWGFLRNRRPDTYKALITSKFVEKRRDLKKIPHYKDEIRALER